MLLADNFFPFFSSWKKSFFSILFIEKETSGLASKRTEILCTAFELRRLPEGFLKKHITQFLFLAHNIGNQKKRKKKIIHCQELSQNRKKRFSVWQSQAARKKKKRWQQSIIDFIKIPQLESDERKKSSCFIEKCSEELSRELFFYRLRIMKEVQAPQKKKN